MIIKCRHCGKEFDKASRRNQHETDAHGPLATANERIRELEAKATGFVEGEPQIRWVYIESGRLNIAGRPTADDAAQYVDGVREVIAAEREVSDKLVRAMADLRNYAECQVKQFSSGRPHIDMTSFPRFIANADAALSEVAAIRKQGGWAATCKACQGSGEDVEFGDADDGDTRMAVCGVCNGTGLPQGDKN